MYVWREVMVSGCAVTLHFPAPGGCPLPQVAVPCCRAAWCSLLGVGHLPQVGRLGLQAHSSLKDATHVPALGFTGTSGRKARS